MASFNKVILIGRLTADPEMRYTPSGKPVVNFTLAVDRRAAAGGGQKETDFVNIVAWQKLAEICSQYLNKGKLIAIDGRLQTRSYENKEGQKVKTFEVVANDMQMLDRPKSGESAERAPASVPAAGAPDEPEMEDVPF